jgi:hypothetical protein
MFCKALKKIVWVLKSLKKSNLNIVSKIRVKLFNPCLTKILLISCQICVHLLNYPSHILTTWSHFSPWTKYPCPMRTQFPLFFSHIYFSCLYTESFVRHNHFDKKTIRSPRSTSKQVQFSFPSILYLFVSQLLSPDCGYQNPSRQIYSSS